MTTASPKLPIPLRVASAGARTAVGHSAVATFACLRARVSGLKETVYRTIGGRRIIGAPVTGVMAERLGPPYLAALAAEPLAECLDGLSGVAPERTALIMSGPTEVAETNGGGSPAVDILHTLTTAVKMEFSPHSQQLSSGPLWIIQGLAAGSQLMAAGEIDAAILGGAHTDLTQQTLRALETTDRLKTGKNSDGIIPGESAAFVSLLPATATDSRSAPFRGPLGSGAVVVGIGRADRSADVRGQSDNAAAWAAAIRSAISEAGVEPQDIGFRVLNLTGERALFLESGLAAMSVFRDPMPLPPSWYVDGSIGTSGAAAGPLFLGWVAAAFGRGYAPGRIALLELADDSGGRAAVVVASR